MEKKSQKVARFLLNESFNQTELDEEYGTIRTVIDPQYKFTEMKGFSLFEIPENPEEQCYIRYYTEQAPGKKPVSIGAIPIPRSKAIEMLEDQLKERNDPAFEEKYKKGGIADRLIESSYQADGIERDRNNNINIELSHFDKSFFKGMKDSDESLDVLATLNISESPYLQTKFSSYLIQNNKKLFCLEDDINVSDSKYLKRKFENKSLHNAIHGLSEFFLKKEEEEKKASIDLAIGMDGEECKKGQISNELLMSDPGAVADLAKKAFEFANKTDFDEYRRLNDLEFATFANTGKTCEFDGMEGSLHADVDKKMGLEAGGKPLEIKVGGTSNNRFNISVKMDGRLAGNCQLCVTYDGKPILDKEISPANAFKLIERYAKKMEEERKNPSYSKTRADELEKITEELDELPSFINADRQVSRAQQRWHYYQDSVDETQKMIEQLKIDEEEKRMKYLSSGFNRFKLFLGRRKEYDALRAEADQKEQQLTQQLAMFKERQAFSERIFLETQKGENKLYENTVINPLNDLKQVIEKEIKFAKEKEKEQAESRAKMEEERKKKKATQKTSPAPKQEASVSRSDEPPAPPDLDAPPPWLDEQTDFDVTPHWHGEQEDGPAKPKKAQQAVKSGSQKAQTQTPTTPKKPARRPQPRL